MQSPNPARNAVWAGWERFTCFEAVDSPLLTEVKAHDSLTRALAKRDLSQACVWLSLAAHMRGSRYELVLKALAERKWGEVPGERLHAVLNEWCRKANARWVLYGPSSGGADSHVLEQLCSAAPMGSKTRDCWNFLQVQSDVGLHLLPLEQASDRIVPHDLIFPAPPAPLSDPSPSESVIPDAASVGLPKPAKSAGGPTPFQPLPGQIRPFTIAYEGVFPPPADFSVPMDDDAADGWQVVEVYGDHLLVGPQYGFSWTCGWLDSEAAPERPSYWRDRPQVVSATTALFARHGGAVLYYLPSSHRFRPLGRRGLTDGVVNFTYFTAGDTLTRGGERWVAVKTQFHGIEMLKVVRSSEWTVFGALRETVRDCANSLPLLSDLIGIKPPPVSVLAPCVEPLPVSVTDKMAYDVARMRMPEEAQPLMQRAFVEWQSTQGGEGAPKAEVAANYVSSLLDHNSAVPFSYSGGHPFEWGYCYSCGANLPGKRMPGRLCGCDPTPAARICSQGGRIAKLGGVTYPGVVTTMSQHPPLKEGKQTLATSQVFRGPPSAERH